MDEDEIDEPPPFWLRNSSPAIRSRGRISSSPILIVILLIVAASLAFIFLVLPSIYSYSTRSKPSQQTHSIKKGWDSLNLVLVLFAVICGFLSRTGGHGGDNDNGGSSQTASRTSSMKSDVTPRTPYRSNYYYGGGYSEENRYGGFSRSTSFHSRTATVRNSFSYPDLRKESAWSSYDVDRRRFYDDTCIDRPGFVDSEQIYGRSDSRRWRDDVDVEEVKRVVEDAAAAAAGVGAKEGEQVKDVEPPQPQSESPLPSPSPPSPPALPAIESQRKHRRRMSYETIPRVWKDDDFGDNVWERPPSTPPPPPPPPPPPLVVYRRDSSEEKKNNNRNGKKRGGSASATMEFFQSIGKKKKKQRQKSIENLEALLGHPSSDRHRLTLSPPPPSPPPTTQSVLQNLFSSKKTRNRNKKTAPHSSPPPSPPPRRTSDISKSKRPRKPEPSFTTVIEEGNRSPLIPIPPAPPPPPPFKVPEWKFPVVHRDYVRIKSEELLCLNSPDTTENEDDQISEGSLMSSPMSSTVTTPNVKGGDGAMFCPSPDVDTKADKFIARFREGLKMEKMNSWNQRQGTNVRSNLGPPIDH